MKINPSNTFDYVYESVLYNQRSSFNQMSDVFNIMMEQASIILETAALDVVQEEATVTAAKGITKAGQKVSSGAKKFIEFIKNMFNRFVEFVSNLFKNNEQWVTDHEKDFGTMNYKGLSISTVPYWEGDAIATSGKIIAEIQKIVSDYSLLDSSKSLNENELKKALENTSPENFLSQYATNGDHVDGIKNLMRVNNKDGKDAVDLSEAALKSRIQDFFIPLVKGHKKVVSDTQKIFNNNENLLNKIDGELNKRSNAVSESFMLMNEPLSVSEASLFFPVIEAEINSNDNKTANIDKENSNAKDSTHGNTKVEVKKNSQADAEADETVAQGTSNFLKIFRNYIKCTNIVLASLLTVTEERMSLSINVLKAVHKEANTRHGRKGNTEGQEKK